MSEFRYEPSPGDRIDAVAGVCARLARQSGENVRFSFNDFELVVVPTDTAAAVVQRYEGASAASRVRSQGAKALRLVRELVAALEAVERNLGSLGK